MSGASPYPTGQVPRGPDDFFDDGLTLVGRDLGGGIRHGDSGHRMPTGVEHRGGDGGEVWRYGPILQREAISANADSSTRRLGSVVGPTPWRWTKESREGKRARTCCGGRDANIAKPLAVSCEGRRTPTSVTSGGRPGARSSMR